MVERGPQGLLLGGGSALDAAVHSLSLPLQPKAPKGPHWLARQGRRQLSPLTARGFFSASDLSATEKARLLAEPFASAGPEAESVHAFFARRLGEGFARAWLPGLVGGLLAAPPDLLGMAALPHHKALEARGGLLLGGLRQGAPRTRVPLGGVGALAQTLAGELGRALRLNHAARGLHPTAEGWCVEGPEGPRDAAAIILALPAQAAVPLLSTLPDLAARLATFRSLDLRVWHSRHAPVPGWERGFNLLVNPAEGRGLLGAVALANDDPRGVPGLLQVRTYLGGAYAVAPELQDWPGVFEALRRWLPELGPALQVREEVAAGAFPLLGVDHGAAVAETLAICPPGLHWLGASRFGPGLANLADGAARWLAEAAR